MGRVLYENNCIQFRDKVRELGNLPKIWQCVFEDGSDQRLWFESVLELERYKSYVEEIDSLLITYGIKRLNDSEREQEFLNYVSKIGRIPKKEEVCFLDNLDMYMWYMSYKKNNPMFEEVVHSELPEYKNFDLAEVWPGCEKEFLSVIKKNNRIPSHGEVKLSIGIDVRVIYDKLVTFDPGYVEKITLYLVNKSGKALNESDRAQLLLDKVRELGYLPLLRECRFSDGVDMFTWYSKNRRLIPGLDDMISELIRDEGKNRKLNIYFIPHFRKSTGKFYVICTNEGERLDISSISSLKRAKDKDSTFVKRGEMLDRGEDNNLGKSRR